MANFTCNQFELVLLRKCGGLNTWKFWMWGLLRLVDQPFNSPYTVSLHFSAVVSPSLVPWIVWAFFFFLHDSVGVYIMRCSLLVYFQKSSDNIAVDFERTLHGYRGCSHPACWTSVLQSRLLVVCLWENWSVSNLCCRWQDGLGQPRPVAVCPFF